MHSARRRRHYRTLSRCPDLFFCESAVDLDVAARGGADLRGPAERMVARQQRPFCDLPQTTCISQRSQAPHNRAGARVADSLRSESRWRRACAAAGLSLTVGPICQNSLGELFGAVGEILQSAEEGASRAEAHASQEREPLFVRCEWVLPTQSRLTPAFSDGGTSH